MSKFTVQDIFINYGDDYIKNHTLSREQWKVFNAIRNCGTKILDTTFLHVMNVVKDI